MTTKADYIASVDNFIAAHKSIAGVGFPPIWQTNRDRSGQETRLQIEVDGVQYGDTLIIWCVPSTGAFHILVTRCGSCISRLDFDDQQGHTNTFFSADDGLPGTVGGRHFHRWSLNKRFIAANGGLEELKHAEELPPSIRGFDQALRWFCDELNISLPHNHNIECPRLLL